MAVNSEEFGRWLRSTHVRIATKESEDFSVPSMILKRCRGVGLNALIGSSQESVINWTEHDQEIVDCVLHFLYTGSYGIAEENNDQIVGLEDCIILATSGKESCDYGSDIRTLDQKIRLTDKNAGDSQWTGQPGSQLYKHTKVFSFASRFCLDELIELAANNIELSLNQSFCLNTKFKEQFIVVVQEVYNDSSGEQSDRIRKVLCRFACQHYKEFEGTKFERLVLDGGEFAIDMCRALQEGCSLKESRIREWVQWWRSVPQKSRRGWIAPGTEDLDLAL